MRYEMTPLACEAGKLKGLSEMQNIDWRRVSGRFEQL